MKKFKYLSLFLVICILISGCGSDSSEDDGGSNISISSKGVVTQKIRESFTENYYDISELNNMILDEISAFNVENHDGDIKATRVELTPDKASTDVELVYVNGKAFSDYNGYKLFVGSGSEALDAGFSLDVVLSSIKDATETIGSADLNSSKNHILITDAMDTVYLPGKVKYISDNACVLEGQKAVKKKNEAEGLMYIVYK